MSGEIEMRCALVLLLLVGCAHQAEPPKASSVVLSAGKWGVPQWEREVSKRFKHAVLVCGHGGTNEKGQWAIEIDGAPGIPAESLARLMKKLYPGRPIVLISCNADGIPLKVPGVFYSKKVVAANPTFTFPDWASRIEEFQEGR